jgi:hypothetical protein
VVPWRAHRAERSIASTGIEGFDRGKSCAYREASSRCRHWARVRVGVEVPTARGAEPLDRPYELCRMDQPQLGVGGWPDLDVAQGFFEAGVTHAVAHRVETSRPLRVTAPGVVVPEALVGSEQDLHDPARYRQEGLLRAGRALT